MALGKYTLFDLAARSGKGIHALMEGVLTFAPELSVTPTFPKAGISYSTLTRTELPTGAFRQVGGGTPLSKSAWKKEVGSMQLFEAQMQVPEDIVVAARAENPDLVLGDLLSDEAIATVKGSTIQIGAQFWYGSKISVDGFVGLSTQVDTANNEVDAGGSAGGDTASAYLVYFDDNATNPQGVHLLLGNGGRMAMSDTWGKQQFPLASDPTKFFNAYTNNLLAYLGLVVPRAQTVYRIKNIDAAHPLTDALVAKLIAKIPQVLFRETSNWRLFMNVNTRYLLQVSRATVTVATTNSKGVSAGGVFPDVPVSSQGVELVVTDSLSSAERAGLHQ